MYGLDVDHNDIYSVHNVPTWEDCGYLCEREERCHFWVWCTERPTESWQVQNQCYNTNIQRWALSFE